MDVLRKSAKISRLDRMRNEEIKRIIDMEGSIVDMEWKQLV